jgi:hypothetical protein
MEARVQDVRRNDRLSASRQRWFDALAETTDSKHNGSPRDKQYDAAKGA